jgi:hypothetical protein
VIARVDFELECVREFSHSGEHLGMNVSREERRERIRVAIMRENKQDTLWRDTALTYAAIYRHVYNKPIDARQFNEEEITLLRTLRAKSMARDKFSDDQKVDNEDANDGL